MGVDDPALLPTLIQTREGVQTLFDRAHARMSSGSARAIYDMLLDFARYCDAMGWPVPPVTLEDRPAVNPQRPIEVYTAEEVGLILRNARVVHGPRWELFLATLAHTGRRVGEVLGLEWAWLNLSADVPHFNLPTTKNGRQAYVPLSAELRELWRDASLPEGRGQFGRDPSVYPFPWTHSCVHKMFTRYCARIGVRSRGFHCFRHTKATELLAAGVPLQAVSALLGHSNVATTDRLYNHATALDYARYLN
jgi:integrase